MGLRIQYPNARQAAYAVHDELQEQGWEPLSARPWNMYDPDHTFWWLVPSTDFPAYKYGKLFFCPKRAPAGHLLCGLHVEKGFGGIVEAAYPFTRGRRLIIQNDWTWFDFLADFDSDRLRSAIALVSHRTTAPVILRLEAGVVQEPEQFDIWEQDRNLKWKPDTVIFESSGSTIEAKACEAPASLLIDLANCHSFDRLTKFIHALPNADWIWLDIFMGTMFEMTPSDTEAWDGLQIWVKALSPWEPWFK